MLGQKKQGLLTVALKDMSARERGSRDSSTQNLVLWPPNGAINDPKRSGAASLVNSKASIRMVKRS